MLWLVSTCVYPLALLRTSKKNSTRYLPTVEHLVENDYMFLAILHTSFQSRMDEWRRLTDADTTGRPGA